jgi:hypothetical protein
MALDTSRRHEAKGEPSRGSLAHFQAAPAPARETTSLTSGAIDDSPHRLMQESVKFR